MKTNNNIVLTFISEELVATRYYSRKLKIFIFSIKCYSKFANMNNCGLLVTVVLLYDLLTFFS